jgi:hypothetical protein
MEILVYAEVRIYSYKAKIVVMHIVDGIKREATEIVLVKENS